MNPIGDLKHFDAVRKRFNSKAAGQRHDAKITVECGRFCFSFSL
jgi:hypothetical protein